MSVSFVLTVISWPQPPNGLARRNSAWKYPASPRGSGQPLVVDVEVLQVLLGALVDQLHQGAPAERHRHVAVERAAGVETVVVIGRRREQRRLEVRDDAVAQAKEIAERGDHARVRGVVPGDPQQALAVVVALGEPQVRDHAGAFDVGQHPGFPGTDEPAILIAAGRVPRRAAAGVPVGQRGELVEHAAYFTAARRSPRVPPRCRRRSVRRSPARPSRHWRAGWQGWDGAGGSLRE